MAIKIIYLGNKHKQPDQPRQFTCDNCDSIFIAKHKESDYSVGFSYNYLDAFEDGTRPVIKTIKYSSFCPVCKKFAEYIDEEETVMLYMMPDGEMHERKEDDYDGENKRNNQVVCVLFGM